MAAGCYSLASVMSECPSCGGECILLNQGIETMHQPLHELIMAVRDLLLAIVHVGQVLMLLAAAWVPLLLWTVFWLWAVNWEELVRVIGRGGWTVLVLIMGTAVLVWGQIAPPVGGTTQILGLNVGNYVEKFLYVVGLVSVMGIAGAVQLSGLFQRWRPIPLSGATPGPVVLAIHADSVHESPRQD